MQVEGLLTNLTNRFEYYGAKILEKQLKEGEEKGKAEGYSKLLNQLIQPKFNVEHLLGYQL